MSTTPRILLTTSEIALRAGVDISTVSNWRRRFDGSFPNQVLTDDAGKRPKFDQAEIDAWLARNPRVAKSADEPAADPFVGLSRLEKPNVVADISGAIAVLITYLRSAGASLNDTTESQIRSWLDGAGLPSVVAELVKVDALPVLVDTSTKVIFDTMAGYEDLAASYDEILAESARRSSYAGEYTTPSALADFLLALAEHSTPGTAYDPAAGSGGLLVAAVRRGLAETAIGVEINRDTALIARRRFYVNQTPGHIYQSDSLLDDPAEPSVVDLVVTDPPFGLVLRPESKERHYPAWEFGSPPKTSSDTGWLQHAIAHLKPHGRAIVVTAMSALSQGGPAGHIRSEMIRRGAVQAIFTTPAKLRSNTGIRLAVWVLGTPDRADRRSSVLLVDAGTDENSKIAADGPAVNAFATWLEGNESELDPSLAIAMPVTELLAPGATLEPRRWLVNPVESVTAEGWMKQATDAYQAALRAESVPDFPELAFGLRSEPNASISIEELVKAGQLSIIRGRHEERDADSAADTYPLLNVKYVRSSGPLDDDAAERVAITEASRGQLVLPGDVVVYPDGETVGARVWREQGWVLGRFMQILRVNRPELIDPGYLAASVTNPVNDRYMTTTAVRTHFDLKQFQVVIPPLEVQAELSHISARLEAIRTAHERAIQVLRAAESILANAVTSGRLEVSTVDPRATT